jgi:hypothetical protein
MSEGMSEDPIPSEVESSDDLAQTPYYHGTRAALLVGDLIKPGYKSNFGSRRQANHVYLTATVDAATWRLAKSLVEFMLLSQRERLRTTPI